ncbi:hypothetical protein LIER_22576 [Lithospermum erythrorhizon]|uniref:Uncharacterized protein n=1 Tax=Lithospermum erythrorhizon TaxID=34254 RepID=A0AAV3QUE8_LITER
MNLINTGSFIPAGMTVLRMDGEKGASPTSSVLVPHLVVRSRLPRGHPPATHQRGSINEAASEGAALELGALWPCPRGNFWLEDEDSIAPAPTLPTSGAPGPVPHSGPGSTGIGRNDHLLGSEKQRRPERRRRESARGERASCMALSGECFGDKRPTLSLADDGKARGEGEGEAKFTPPTDVSLLLGGCPNGSALSAGHGKARKR